MNYDKMWNKIKSDLIEISSDRYSQDMPEISLIVAIIVQAAQDNDAAYFKTREFERHAVLLRISPVFIRILVKTALKVVDSREPWVYTPSLEEEI